MSVAIGLALLAAAPALAENPPPPPSQTEQKVIQSLSNLDARKLGALLDHLGIAPAPEFFACLCPNGFHAYQGPDGGPCRRIGTLGGTTFAGYNMAAMQTCAAAHPFADGRNVLDAITAAAADRRLAALHLSDDDLGKRMRSEIAALKKACLPIASPVLTQMLAKYDRDLAARGEAAGEGGEGRGSFPATALASPGDKETFTRALTLIDAKRDAPCEGAIEAKALIESRMPVVSAEEIVGIVIPNDAVGVILKGLEFVPTVGWVAKGISTFRDLFQAGGLIDAADIRGARVAGLEEFLMRFRMTRGADNAALQAQIHDPELKLDDAAARVQMNTARIAALREQLSGFSVIPSNDYTAEAKRSELTQQLADSVQALKKATLEQIRSQTIVSYLQQYRQPLIEKGCEAFLAERRAKGECDK